MCKKRKHLPLQRVSKSVALSAIGYSWSKKEKETFPEQIDNKKDLLRTMSSRRHNEWTSGDDNMWEMETKNSNGIQMWRDTGNTYRRVRHN